ncbi:MAG: hypothetical protein JST00_39255 [Deltaproteobacteria bacterium]|nr:hypothetical protein [Deltaproteobacteria bacterium]
MGSTRARGIFFIAFAAFVLLLLGSARSAHAQSIKIRVKGNAKITAHAARDPGSSGQDGLVDLVLSGSLADDAGEPLAAQGVRIKVSRESDPRDPQVSTGIRAARSCDRGTDPRPTAYAVRVEGPAESPEVVTVTDESGRFCFRARLVPDRHRAHLSWPGQNLVEGVASDVAFDLSRQTLRLRFDPPPKIVGLDNARTNVEAAAFVDDEALSHPQARLALTLTNEKNEELGRGTTDGFGRARFLVETARLGPPGRGELRVSFAGDRDTAFATQSAEIERRVKVTLRVPALEKGEMQPQVPEDGIPLIVDVGSVVGPVGEGTVEARIGETMIGAAPVERGIARVTLTFSAPGAEANVRLRYVPTAPWFEPLGEPIVHVPIRGPGLLSKAPILVAGLAVLAFFLVGRVASKSTKVEPAPSIVDAKEANVGKARVDVVRAAGRGETGWRGTVIDAHDGSPVRGARLWIERGTFEGRTVLASVGADARGRFALGDVGKTVGDEQLGCEAPLHARLLQPLPPPGELSIAVVLRRRALLQRLVAWAKRKGRPFDVKPEPTPGHVRKAAGDDFQTARWADAIERAVYGAGEVDARTEAEIERMVPSPGGARENEAAEKGREPPR